MVAPAAIQAGKIVVGKIAEQVAIQAAAELLLRRVFKGRGDSAAPADNPIADLEVSALFQTLVGGGGTAAAPAKRKRTKWNRAMSKHIKALRKARTWKNKSAAVRFKRAVVLSKQELKNGSKKKH